MSRDYNIAWEVTGNCNHNCFYCYNFWRNDNISSICYENSETAYNRVTDKLIELQPVSVTFTGGEALLVFDKIRDSISRLSEKGIFIRLFTNGSLITEEIAEFLAKHHVQVMVSFPSSDDSEFSAITEKNSYDSVLRGLDFLKEYNADTLVNVVVSTVNLGSMEATADFLVARYGYRNLYFSRATKPQNASEELQRVLLDNEELQVFFDNCLKIKENHKIDVRTCGGYAYCSIRNKKGFSVFAKGCGAGRSGFVISNDGSVRVCSKDSQVFGNIFENDVELIVDRAKFWTDESAIPEECRQCRYRKQCRGGCHMSSAESTPKYNSLDFNAEPSSVTAENKKYKRRTYINPLKKYILDDRTYYCRTDRGNRFSNVFLWLYLSDELTKVLNSKSEFSFLTVVRKSGCSFEESKKIFLEMINKRIITEKH